MLRRASRLAPIVLPLLTGCNVLVGFSELEKADCVTGCGADLREESKIPDDTWMGRRHACATMEDKSLQCWGWNGRGQLGDGTIEVRSVPTPVEGLPDDVEAVALGLGHTCAVLEDHTVYCWGANDHGQLGNGSTQDSVLPVLVVGSFGGADKIQAGEEHTCVEATDGTVWCWGGNSDGQLGDTTTMHRPSPIRVGLNGTVKKLSSGGGRHTCAALDDGSVSCWGLNQNFQLGAASPAASPIPLQVAGIAMVDKVYAGRQHSCAVSGTGTVLCWGANNYGQLGDGTTTQRAAPAPVTGLTGIETVGTGFRHTCASTKDTQLVSCWGVNDHGQLGQGTLDDQFLTAPKLVQGLIVHDARINTKGEHTCAVADDHYLYCWGMNDDAQVGDGTQLDRLAPVRVDF